LSGGLLSVHLYGQVTAHVNSALYPFWISK